MSRRQLDTFSAQDVRNRILADSDSDDDDNSSDSESESEHSAEEDMDTHDHDNTNEDSYDWTLLNDVTLQQPNWQANNYQRKGILVEHEDYECMDFFQLCFPNEAFELIVEHTNLYALQFFDSTVELSAKSRFRKFDETNVAEVKAFVALQIAMGLVEKPAEQDYWSQYWLTQTPAFGTVMSRNKYQSLKSFLHFNDNSQRIARGHEGHDPLFKIRPLLDLCQSRYEAVYRPETNLSVDESMVKFKGRIYFKQYMPAKPIKWGIKEFCLCESGTGYCLKSITYTGKNSFVREAGVPLGTQVVMQLTSGYENLGYKVFTDNFYSSPDLFTELESNGIGSCGTVNANRKNMPKELSAKRLPMKRGDDPVFMKSRNLVACAWHDVKRVTLLSTIDTNGLVKKRIRTKETQAGYREINKPSVVDSYNKHMSGVDRLDQKLSSYPYPHKSQKWYHTIFHRTIEIALINGFVLMESAQPNSKMSPIEFRRNVIDGLLKGYSSTKDKNSKCSQLDRLTDRHFLDRYETARLDCIVCSDRSGTRHQSRFFCKQCHVTLCAVPCFEKYHTLVNFRTAQNMEE